MFIFHEITSVVFTKFENESVFFIIVLLIDLYFDSSSTNLTDNRITTDQVDLREDLSSEQGGTGSASGSSLSASAYRGNC